MQSSTEYPLLVGVICNGSLLLVWAQIHVLPFLNQPTNESISQSIYKNYTFSLVAEVENALKLSNEEFKTKYNMDKPSIK